jgi:uncharacterized delta-60 repeat protein
MKRDRTTTVRIVAQGTRLWVTRKKSGLARTFALPVALLIAAMPLVSQAQSPTADDFNPQVASAAYALAVQADGKVVVGGEFWLLGSQGLGRLNADGTLDTTFDPGVSDSVYTVAVQADGKILVGGYFTSLGGVSRGFLGRLNANGSVDATFDPEPNAAVLCLAVQADGKIVVGGQFTTLRGVPRSSIGRLNPDGTLDSGFNSGAGIDLPGMACLAIQADGKIVVGGSFSLFNGQARANLARLNADGMLDTSFNPGTGGDYPFVRCLAVQGDGKILVGGDFATLGGQPRNCLGRLNADGTVDSGFNPGADNSVWSLAVQTDGKILVGGGFAALGGWVRAGFGRLNANGSLDTGFDPMPDNTVTALAVQTDGRILAAGNFTILGGQPRLSLGRLNSTGPATSSLSFDGSNVVWQRSGTSPEVWGAAFDASTNGTDWISLGTPMRISGGWQQTGLWLPTSATIRARGFVSSGSGNASQWFVEAGFGPPKISLQPGSQTVNAGAMVQFTAAAVGSAPLNCQWWKDGAALRDGDKISGATTATLSLTNVLRADQGAYCVVISNNYGSVTSALAKLTVVEPVISTQPVGELRAAGSSIVLYVVADGTPPISYQWRKDGVDLADGGVVSDATTPNLTLTGVLHADGGDYTVVISNAYGMLTSEVATVTVVDPVITRQPVNVAGNAGATVVLSVEAAGTPPLSYQWSKGGTSLAGATTSSLTLTNLQAADAGAYRVVVTNVYGILLSTTVSVTISLTDPFNPGASGGYVESLAVQPDGKIVAGGLFTQLAGQSRRYFGRVNADGTPDIPYNPRPGDWVNCLTVHGSGQITLGGGFASLGGQSRGGVGRLDASGGLDAGFRPNVSYSYLNCLAVQPDGKVLIGGSFGALWRLNADGTPDATFTPASVPYLYCLALQPNGKILVGGTFSALAGQPRSNIGRLNANGTLDTNFNASVSAGFSGNWGSGVLTLAVLPSGKILVGGNFGILNGSQHICLGCLNPDGTLDTNFTANANNFVHSFAPQADGKILVGGDFTSLRNGFTNVPLTLNGVGRLNANGTVDTNFTNPKALGSVLALALQADGKIVIGGQFTSLSGVTRVNIGRLVNTGPATESLGFDGSTITWLRGGTAPEVWRTTLDYSTDGTNWSSLGAGTRIAGGWQVTGVSVPAAASFRAWGFVTGGHYNASGSVVESVLDRTPPQIDCPADMVVTNAHDAWTTVVTYSPAVTDNRPGVGAPVCEPPSGSAFGIGSRIVNCSVADAAGNSNQCSFRVTVWPGNQPPRPVIRLLPVPGCCALTACSQPNLLVLACDGARATVVCDGSSSSDPDDASFRFAWFDGASQFSTNRVAVTDLPLGTHVITLVLDDTFPGGTNRASATVQVLSPAQAVGRLVSLVQSSPLPANRQQPLLATLRAATAAVERRDLRPALEQLGAFENKVRAQMVRLDPALAATLFQTTERIIAALRCCESQRHVGEVRSVTRHGNRVRLAISGPAAQVYLVQASMDLIHWEAVGAVATQGEGSLEFEDADSGTYPSRFYRLVSP